MEKVCRNGWVPKIVGFGGMSHNLPAPMDQGPQLASTSAKEAVVKRTILHLTSLKERELERERWKRSANFARSK